MQTTKTTACVKFPNNKTLFFQFAGTWECDHFMRAARIEVTAPEKVFGVVNRTGGRNTTPAQALAICAAALR